MSSTAHHLTTVPLQGDRLKRAIRQEPVSHQSLMRDEHASVGICLGAVHVALARGDREAAERAIDEFFTANVTLQSPVAALGLDDRICNALWSHGIRTVSDLLGCTKQRLMEIRNFGPLSVDRIFDALAQNGWTREATT